MVAALASPAPSSVKHRRHPPYKEMILRAIESLKDRNGSSRTAISKFIASTYSDFPPAHVALLSTHIRRLKKKGLLCMVKHSYKLAHDSAGALSPTPKPHGQPRKSPAQRVSSKGQIPDSFVPKKRGRPCSSANLMPPAERGKPGRPRKTPPVTSEAGSTEKRKSGRPRQVPQAATALHPGADTPLAVLILPKGLKRALGSMHAAANISVEKRKLGRPRKISPASSLAMVVDGNNTSLNPMQPSPRKVVGDIISGRSLITGAVNSSVEKKKLMPAAVKALIEKRKPGRPRKVSSSFPSAKAVHGSAALLNSLQQLPGKLAGDVEPGLNPMPAAVKASAEKRKLVRPRKAAGELEPGLGPMPQPVSTLVEKRKPGRPRKASSSSSVLAVDDNATSLSSVQPSPGKVIGEVELGPGPMPAVVNPSVETRNPAWSRKVLSSSSALVHDDNATSPNTVQPSPGKAAGEAESGFDPMLAALTASGERRKPGRPRKVLSPSSSSLVGDGSVILLNSLLSSSGKAVGEVEPMMHTIKRRCGLPKRSNLFGPASVEGKMVVEEKRKRSVGRPRKNAGGRYF